MAFVHGHGVCRLQFGQHIKGVVRLTVFKEDADPFGSQIHRLNDTDIAVKNACAHIAAVELFPYYIIVIPNLHHPIALSERKITEFFLFFRRMRWVEMLLQHLVQLPGTDHALSGGGQHLYLIGRNAHVFWQTDADQLRHRLLQLGLGMAGQEEEVLVLAPKIRHVAFVDAVGVHDDQALLGLTEDLSKTDSWDHAAL